MDYGFQDSGRWTRKPRSRSALDFKNCSAVLIILLNFKNGTRVNFRQFAKAILKQKKKADLRVESQSTKTIR